MATDQTQTNKKFNPVLTEDMMKEPEISLRATNETRIISPEEIQGRFALLRDLNADEMTALNKKVVKTIDWRMMPCVTIMFLMKYVYATKKCLTKYSCQRQLPRPHQRVQCSPCWSARRPGHD